MIKKFRWLGKKAILALNFAAAIAILMAYLSVYISPLSLSFLPFFGISYGVLLVVNMVFVFFWLMVKRRYALISGIAIILGLSHLNAYFQLLPGSSVPESSNSIKLVSHNVRLFGWYNWKTNKAERDGMLGRLAGIEADVYCFQEYFHQSKIGGFDVSGNVKKQLKTPYLHEAFTLQLHGDQLYGMATASKHPIVGKGSIKFPGESSNACIYTDIAVKGDTIRVYNAHVASIRFTDSNYRFIEDLVSYGPDHKPEYSEGISILGRMSRAYQRRARQVQLILDHIESSPYRVVLCGDINDTPVSYTYGTLSRKLNDAFRNGGWGIGNTYLGRFPSFRIDYIFHDRAIKSSGYITHPEDSSDHHAISCTLHLAP